MRHMIMLQELEQALKNTKRTRSILPCTFIKTSINNILNILRSHSLVADSLRSPRCTDIRLVYTVSVFHHSVHHIRRDARRRDPVLRFPPESADDHATGDAQDHSVLRRRPVHYEGVGRPPGRSKTAGRQTATRPSRRFRPV